MYYSQSNADPKGGLKFKKEKKENTQFTKSPFTSLFLQMAGLLIDSDVVAGYSPEEGVSEAVDCGGAYRGVEETGSAGVAVEGEIFGYGKGVNSDL